MSKVMPQTNPGRPTLSILLPSLRAAALQQRIQEFAATNPEVNYELVVVSPFAVTGPRVVSVQETERRGCIAAMNLAFQHASGDFIAYWSDDCSPTPGCLGAMLEFVQRHRSPFIGSFRLLDPAGKELALWRVYDRLYACWGMVSRETLNQVGGLFRPDFRSFWADPDLGLRVWQAGGQVQACPDAFVTVGQIVDELRSSNQNKYFEADTQTFFARWQQQYRPGQLPPQNWQEINTELPPAEALGRTFALRTPAAPATVTPAPLPEEASRYLVSALVPLYKSERFIRGLLEDLEAQTIADRLEIVIVETGSPENERAIIEEFQRRYSNIVYVHTDHRENGHAALNRGIALARGKYLTLACADDRHRRDAFELMAAALEAEAAAGLVYADSAITRQENQVFETAPVIGIFRWPAFNHPRLFRGNYIGPHPMWRRDLHTRFGGFDESMAYAGDYEMWLRFAQGTQFLHIPEVLGLYLQNVQGAELSNRKACDAETQVTLKRYWPRQNGALPPFDNNFHEPTGQPVQMQELETLKQTILSCLQQERWTEGAEVCAKLLQHTPKDTEVLLFLAKCLFETGDRKRTELISRRVLELDPTNEVALENLALLQEKPRPRMAPFRVVAIIAAHNEGDVIYHVIGDLIANHVEVYLIDHCSTDNTVAEASKWLGKGLLKIERFPEECGYAARNNEQYVWRDLLRRKEELAAQLGADWYIHADADEFRESPWPALTLADAIQRVDKLGYNAINFELLNFRPTDDRFVPGSDVREHLVYYDGAAAFDALQIKAWKNTQQPVRLVPSGGHSVDFGGRRVCPVHFLVRHYPIRGETHGRKKVFGERLPRFAPEERADGWHVQYNEFLQGKTQFLHDPAQLLRYDGHAVRAQLLGRTLEDVLLLQTLSGQHDAPRVDENALTAWAGRQLGLSQSLPMADWRSAEQLLPSLMQAMDQKTSALFAQIDVPVARLLLVVIDCHLAVARTSGGSLAAKHLHDLRAKLQDCVAAPRPEQPGAPALESRNSEPQPGGSSAPAPKEEAPAVSIIIPVHNHWALTQQCLTAIFQTQAQHQIEIVVVDNASTDQTAASLQELAKSHPQLRTITNAKNATFSRACNQGARVARGQHLLFLNNDTIPHAGWLDPLVQMMAAEAGVGVLGSKLLYADGTIQHAGVVVGQRDGDPFPYHVYLCQPANAPFVNKAREFQMVTGACLMIRRDLFQQVGGFDEAYVNGHEDLDLCLKARAAGYQVRYCPQSVVTHLESRTKRLVGLENFHYQKGVDNEEGRGRQRFLNRWRQVLQVDDTKVYAEDGIRLKAPAQPTPTPAAPASAAPVAPAARPASGRSQHILFTMYGWAEEGGGTILPRQIAKALVRRGHRVSVIYTAAQPRRDRPAYHVESHQEDGVELYAIYNRPALFYDLERPDREIEDPQMREVVLGLVRRLQPDVVHYHSLLNFSLGTVEAIGALGIPAVYTSHNYWPLCPRMYLFQRDLTLCGGPSADGARCAACLGVPAQQAGYALRSARGREVFARHIFRHLAVSSRVRELFIQNGHAAERIVVLQQQPETVEWLWREVGAKRSPGLRPDGAPLQVGFIGSLLPQKGVHVLVGALQALPANRVQLHIFGGGNEPYLKQLQAFDKTRAVQFHGAYQLPQLPRLLQGIDLMVVPSVWEDCAPLVVAEALAARCPVIGSRIGGIPDFIAEGQTGLLVPPNDPKALATALARFIQEPSLVGAMQQAIAAPRGFGAFLDDLEGHYRDAIGQQSHAVTATGSNTAAAPDPLHIVWEGSQFVNHSLALVNREMCLALLKQGQAMTLVPYEPDQFGPEADPRFGELAARVRRPLERPVQVHVRHQWPPNFSAPPAGKWVLIQPWEFGPIPEQWVQELGQKVDEVWVPSRFVRQCYLDSGVAPAKVHVVPNGVNPEVFHPGVAPRPLPTTKKFKFLFVGGTIGRKGADVLLKAYVEAFRASEDVCLVIKDFGANSCYQGQTLGQQISELQKQPQAPEILYLQQELPPQELPGLYTACDCLVHPYRGEGFGLPVIEAMACGLPVVVTGGGATDDFATDEVAYRLPASKRLIGDQVSGQKLAGTGWLLEPDRQALAARMKWIVTHPAEARATGRRASEYARREWSWERAAQVATERLRALQAQAGAAASTAPALPAGKSAPLPLPACARIGDLAQARELLGRKALPEAWTATLEAINGRPFHPEAYLLLAQLAHAAGDAAAARRCAQYAHTLAPDWKPAKRFLKSNLRGNAKPNWLRLPGALTHAAAPRLSVCLITKNEEKHLGRCLTSIRALADQVVVVDTGSTDRTVEIAKEHGAEVYSFAWSNDFSAARNAALEHARGDWVLILDADEELPSDQHARLRADIKTSKVIAYRLPIVNYGREIEGQGFVPRLFRNAPGAYFRNRVHEQVFSSLLPLGHAWGLTGGFGTAQLLHHGYTPEIIKERNKVERNLTLLRQAVQEYPTDPNLAMNLGLELVRSGDLPTGLTHYREAVRLMNLQPPGEVPPELREVLLTQFSSQLRKARLLEEAVQVLTSPLAKNSGLTASMHLALGLSYYELSQYAPAAEQMRQCLARLNQPTRSPINPEIHTTVPHHCLALSLAKLGDAAGADQAYQAGLNKTGRVEELRLDYAKFLLEQKRAVDAFHQLHQIVAENAQNTAAWRLGGQIALSQPEFLEFARDWTGEALNYLPQDQVLVAQRAEALLLSQATAPARELWERLWQAERDPRFLAGLILCEILEDTVAHRPQGDWETAATSRAFIEWYRKCLGVGAKEIVLKLNTRTEELGRALPEAARILQAALSEAERPEAAECCPA